MSKALGIVEFHENDRIVIECDRTLSEEQRTALCTLINEFIAGDNVEPMVLPIGVKLRFLRKVKYAADGVRHGI